MIFIFTYNRPDMLRSIADECYAGTSEQITIIDDGSNYEHYELPGAMIHVFHHEGKPGFYKRWHYALDLAEETDDDFFLFLPDDYSDIDFESIMRMHEQLRHRPYCVQVVNDGRGPQWTMHRESPFNDELTRTDWQDCSFFCNRAALKAVGFYMTKILPIRFMRNQFSSSGVGEQLTRRFNTAGVPIYRPIKSLAFHGEHDSVMHPDERKRNPLISK